MEEQEFKGRNEVYSKSVRAGKRRTYFFDVKTTKANDYYLVITESKKKFNDDGSSSYEKHKIFLYKEDFDKFAEGLNETIAHIRTIAPAMTTSDGASSNGASSDGADSGSDGYSDLKFEDLSGEPTKE
jgi:Protein of unknown function (DUF3276)